jgi:hypothetical protein
MLNPNLSKLIFKIRFTYIKKVSMYLIFTLLILCGIIFIFNFDTTTSCFLSPHINFMCDKDSVIISKVHYESFFFLIIHCLIRFLLKSIRTWIIKKLTM